MACLGSEELIVHKNSDADAMIKTGHLRAWAPVVTNVMADSACKVFIPKAVLPISAQTTVCMRCSIPKGMAWWFQIKTALLEIALRRLSCC